MIGATPGEKFYEDLMSKKESRRTVAIPEYFAFLTAFKSLYHDIDYSCPDMNGVGVDDVYNSTTKDPISKEEGRIYLYGKNLLEPHDAKPQHAHTWIF